MSSAGGGDQNVISHKVGGSAVGIRMQTQSYTALAEGVLHGVT